MQNNTFFTYHTYFTIRHSEEERRGYLYTIGSEHAWRAEITTLRS